MHITTSRVLYLDLGMTTYKETASSLYKSGNYNYCSFHELDKERDVKNS